MHAQAATPDQVVEPSSAPVAVVKGRGRTSDLQIFSPTLLADVADAHIDTDDADLQEAMRIHRINWADA